MVGRGQGQRQLMPSLSPCRAPLLSRGIGCQIQASEARMQPRSEYHPIWTHLAARGSVSEEAGRPLRSSAARRGRGLVSNR
jgi:hypothetical protein